MADNISTLNNNYELIYVNLDNSINLVKKDVWITYKDFTLDSNTILPIKNFIKASKITQIHTSQYLYLSENCNLYVCEADFTNPRMLSDIKFQSVTQLSNYLIVLTGTDGRIYSMNSIKNPVVNLYYDDGNFYTAVKQTGSGPVTLIQGTMCGETFTFDLTKDGLTNKSVIKLDKTWTNRLTIISPDKTKVFNFNCDEKNKMTVRVYDFSYNLNISSSKSTECELDEDFDGGLCYTKCRDGYKGIGPVCWQKCDDGWIDDGATCRKTNACKDDEDHDGALCYPKCRDGYKGEGPVCWKKCDDGWIDDGATCRKTNACEDNQDHDGALCYPKCRDGYSGVGPVCWKKCDNGWIDDGATCRKTNACEDNQDHDGALCYPKCRDGYSGVGPVCWQKCNDGWIDDGATCRKTNACEDNQDHDGALCYPKCRDGYQGDGPVCWKSCNGNDIDVGALCRERCRNEYNDIAGVCWKDKPLSYDRGIGTTSNYSCPTGYKLNGLNCVKDCPDGFEQRPGDIVSCWNKNQPYDRGVGKIPSYSCLSGYVLNGTTCVKSAPTSYKINAGDIVNYWLNESVSYPIAPGTMPSQDNSACNGLSNVVVGVGTCTGWDNCSYKTPVTCTKLCKSCTYDNYTPGCSVSNCGCDKTEAKCCDNGIKTRVCFGTCKWSYSWGCNAERCGTTCTVAKCCDKGLKTTLTGVNCDKCGTYDSCTGGDCIGEIKTRPAPRSCPSGKEFDDLKTLCYEKCRDGYEKRPGDVVSCWNKKPTTIAITDKKDAIMSCPSGMVLEAGLCYEKPRDGYSCVVTSCNPTPLTKTINPSDVKAMDMSCPSDKVLQAGLCYTEPKDDYTCDVTVCSLKDPSYVPTTYDKDSYVRGSGSPDVLVSSKDSYGRGAGSPDTLIRSKDSYGRGAGSPDTLIKAKDSYGRGAGTPDTLIKDKDSYGRGAGKLPKKYDQIVCGDCCSFDLSFVNVLFNKPNDLILPIIPVTNNLLAYYDSTSYLNGIWYDLTSNLNNVVNITGQINKFDNYITGDKFTKMLFPFDILPSEYTVFHVCKYNGVAQGKILSGYKENWFSGFGSGKSGIAFHDKFITQNEISLFDNKWVFSTDANNLYRANQNNYTTVNYNYNKPTQLSINYNDSSDDNSDWAIACIIVFDRKLSDNEITDMENWLVSRYSGLWSQTYSKTFKQLGYSCFDNKIGTIVNNYKNYEYITYDTETVDCKYLNYPQKKDLNRIYCITSDEQKNIDVVENFNSEQSGLINFINKYIDTEFILKVGILLILLVFVIKLSRKKNI